ncbi:unnamed protein product, partial [Laminaria digitata]
MKQHYQSRLSAVGLFGLAVGSQGFAPLVLSRSRRLQQQRTATTSVIASSSNCYSSTASSNTNSNTDYHHHHLHHHINGNWIRCRVLPFFACSSAPARGSPWLVRLRTDGRPGQVQSAVLSSPGWMEPEADGGGYDRVEAVEEG